tara:strand:+ start:720 stop:1418 length:699 start_codon:yes stop_codon:yes gene_type:complete
MLKEKNQMYKIAIIDNETELFSILDEQKDAYKNYTWVHFKSLKKLIDKQSQEIFNLYIFNETIINHESFKIKNLNNIKELNPILFIISSNNRYRDRLLKNQLVSKILYKPFRLNFFVKMIDEILKFQNKKKLSDIQIGSYILKPSEKKIISQSNKKILLTDIELKILVKLGQHDGEYVKREEVFKQVWDIKNSDSTHTLQTHIYRLRKKLSAKFGDKLLIKSKIGRYSLICQ